MSKIGFIEKSRRGETLQSPLRAATNAFLIFHIVSLTCWAIPLNNTLLNSYREMVSPWFLWSGLFQSWNMFSPLPKAVNSYVEGIVVYADGGRREWRFPRMEHLGFSERYIKERYRKYVENLTEDTNRALWPDAVRFIARRSNTRAVPIKYVVLVRHWAEITPGTSGASAKWQESVFYGGEVLFVETRTH